MNTVYQTPADCPDVIPVFPLSGALLLPRGQIPLNVFEPRYVAMVDDALRAERIIGLIQPEEETRLEGRAEGAPPRLYGVGCAGRITQFAETGDGRYVLTLTGIARFRLAEELVAVTPYRQARVDYSPFLIDFTARAGEEEVDRDAVVRTLREFAEVNELKIDWKGVREAPSEALVNALSMMCPFGPREKQALLEAPDLRTRADVLVAITEMEIARGGEGEGENMLQ